MLSPKLKRLVYAPLLALFVVFPAIAEDEYYDEIYDKHGRVRPQYQEVIEEIDKMSPTATKRFLRETRREFSGDNALDPMPRIIPAEEYDNVLKKGVEQRARAIRAFLQDHYSGKRHYMKFGIIPERVILRLLERNLEIGYDGKVPPEIISFLYGPDIIRDRRGQWRVIEDNPGFIGGIGDLRLAQKLIVERIQAVGRAIKFRKADAFYKTLTDRFKERAAKKGGRVVMYQTAPYADHEDKRLRRIMEEHGILVVTDQSKWKFKINSEGVFVYDSSRPDSVPEKVGFVFMNGEYSWLDPRYPVNYKRMVIEEARGHLEEPDLNKTTRLQLEEELAKPEPDLDRIKRNLYGSNFESDIAKTLAQTRHAEGLTEAILSKKVDSNYSPGIDFIGDKEFYLYVEKLIEFYLGEKPILRNIPTKRFSIGNGSRLNEILLERVFKNLDQYVIKKVDGRGGDAVWVGPKVRPEEIADLKQRIRSAPDEYIVQEYTPLSRLNGNIVDLRVIADVAPKDIFVTDTPWGRGLPADGNGKVNLSDKGREITVLVRTGTWGMCRQLFYLP